jgi:hypothetical protein
MRGAFVLAGGGPGEPKNPDTFNGRRAAAIGHALRDFARTGSLAALAD